MKKKEKLPKYVLITRIIVFIMILFFFGLFAYYKVFFVDEPHFNITKEVCRNETSYKDLCINTKLFYMGKLLKTADYYIRLIDECKANDCSNLKEFQEKLNKTYEEFDIVSNQSNPCIEEKQICERIEVEEIEILSGCFFLPFGASIGCGEICEPTKAKYCDEKGCEVCYISKISKQDLTTEWLNNHCECFGDCYFNSRLEFKVDWGENKSIPTNCNWCSKYKCELDENKYFVEIIR